MTDKYGDRCPICRTKWKITTFGTKVWKDCLECGDTAENLVAKAEKETPKEKYNGIDITLTRDAIFPLDPNGGWSSYDDLPEIDDDDWSDIPFLFTAPETGMYDIGTEVILTTIDEDGNITQRKLDPSEYQVGVK